MVKTAVERRKFYTDLGIEIVSIRSRIELSTLHILRSRIKLCILVLLLL